MPNFRDPERRESLCESLRDDYRETYEPCSGDDACPCRPIGICEECELPVCEQHSFTADDRVWCLAHVPSAVLEITQLQVVMLAELAGGVK